MVLLPRGIFRCFLVPPGLLLLFAHPHAGCRKRNRNRGRDSSDPSTTAFTLGSRPLRQRVRSISSPNASKTTSAPRPIQLLRNNSLQTSNDIFTNESLKNALDSYPHEALLRAKPKPPS